MNALKELEADVAQTFLEKYDLAMQVGNWKNAVVFKLQKPAWTEGGFGQGIFFSVWMEPKDEKRNQVLYNIHALKHRLMEGYIIKSNEFAESFRKKLVESGVEWPNVSLDYGPQTLMQGWIPLQPESFKQDVNELLMRFTQIHQIIDEMLEERRIL